MCVWRGLVIIKFKSLKRKQTFLFWLQQQRSRTNFFILNDRTHQELSTFLRHHYSWSRVRPSSCSYWTIGHVSDRGFHRAYAFSCTKHHHRDASLIVGPRSPRRYIRACIYVCLHAAGASPGDCQSNHERARYSRHSRRSVVARDVHVA